MFKCWKEDSSRIVLLIAASQRRWPWPQTWGTGRLRPTCPFEEVDDAFDDGLEPVGQAFSKALASFLRALWPTGLHYWLGDLLILGELAENSGGVGDGRVILGDL